MSMIVRATAGSTSSAPLRPGMPALHASRSIRPPPRASRSAASFFTASGSPTSQTWMEVSTGSEMAAASSRSAPRATSASRQWRVARRRASARPMPEEPPVITASGRASIARQRTSGGSRRVREVTEPRAQVELTVSNRTLLRLLAVSTAFLLVAWLLWEIRDVLQMLLVAGFLALALNPAVTWLELRGWRRGRAVAVVFVVTLVAVGAVLTVVFAPLYEEVRRFARDVPRDIDDLRPSQLLR